MKIVLIYPFYNGCEIRKEVEFNEFNIDLLVKDCTEITKFFNDKFTDEEIAQLKQQSQKYLLKNGKYKKNTPQFVERLSSITSKSQRCDLNDTNFPIFEGIKKIKDNEYMILWGT